MRRLLLLLTLLSAASSAGCGKVREISRCRAVSRDVNPALDEIEALSKKPGAEQELRMAKRYAELAKRVQARGSGSASLAPALREYVSVLAATDVALRAHAEATRTNHTSKMVEARRDLDRLAKREKAAAARLEAECHS